MSAPFEPGPSPKPDGLTELLKRLEVGYQEVGWPEALRATHERFLAIGGALAALTARVTELDNAHSERLMALEENLGALRGWNEEIVRRLRSAEKNLVGHEKQLANVDVGALLDQVKATDSRVSDVNLRLHDVEHHPALEIPPLPNRVPKAGRPMTATEIVNERQNFECRDTSTGDASIDAQIRKAFRADHRLQVFAARAGAILCDMPIESARVRGLLQDLLSSAR